MSGGLEGKRYSPFDRDEVHRDMRVDPRVVAKSVSAQPMVAEAHRNCEECARLLPAPPRPPTHVGKVRLSLAQVAEMLALPPELRPIRMYVTDDPHDLCVIVEGDVLEEAPPFGETPSLST